MIFNSLKSKISSFFSCIKSDLIVILKYFVLFLSSIIFWELLLRTHIGFQGVTFYFLLFLPAEAMFLATLCGWFSHKVNRFATPVVMLLPFAFYVSQLIYYRIFGSLISLSMLGMGTSAVGNFGWALWDTIKTSVLWIIACFIPVIASVVLAIKLPKNLFGKFNHWLHLATLAKTVILWLLAVGIIMLFGRGAGSPYYVYSSVDIDTDTAADRLGVLTNTVVEAGYKLFGAPESEDTLLVVPDGPDDEPSVDLSPNIIAGLDFETLKNSTDDKGKKELCDYFAALSGTNKNEYTGAFKDYNLIYICAESFSQYAIDPQVTPTLYKLSQGGFVLNNFYNSYKNTTTNGEFTFATGLWPDVSRDADSGSSSGSFAQSAKNYLPFSLGNMFENIGIKSYAYHNFRGSYYSRHRTHPNLGYSTVRFMGGTNGMKFTTSWPSSDYEMMQQSVDDYINNEQFHTYYMTFSGHGPYSDANKIAVRNIEIVRKLAEGKDYTDNALYYLAANYELEKAMTYLLERLEEAGKLNNTMIVIVGDHYPYYLNDASLNSIAGHKVEKNFEKYESTCIMWCGGMEPVQVDTPCCNVDILPTVLNLFGLEYDSRLLSGADIFSNGSHMAMLYNKSFVTDKAKYNAQTGEAEWFSTADSMTDDEKNSYLDYYIALTKSKYQSALKMMDEDFYRFALGKEE